MNDIKFIAMKKQFAYELFMRTQPLGLEHEATFSIAQEIARRIYPFDPTSSSALRIANEWVKDPLVVDTYLRLKSDEIAGLCLPTKAQFVMAIVDRLDRIDEEIGSLKRDSAARKKANRLRRSFVEMSQLATDCLQ
ncbi:hypothetical protein [Stenotrophobium rhamnosiphilum]|uniref:Uncharacterized protein n=1 Tax=Stenotrophobium rhamnosiphilum TaxID=2029166 RepID=A0A2T5MI45_9GAMM|nr:hypothetical protein [Stenotrophobium rhamnosiphilum]PTU32246.1 hypothetical protein CJD38_06200 [Stenotrophobium rhamnosiphilum]